MQKREIFENETVNETIRKQIIIKCVFIQQNSYKLFNLEKDSQLKYLPFIVCCLKFALIFPMMTSNAEIYTFLSLFGWFIVGLNERRYDNLKLNI